MRIVLISFITLALTACDKEPQNIALGTLERDRIAHTATINEVVIELPVEKGSRVEKGTVLVRLDDTQQQAHVAKARAEVANAKANLEKLRNGARKEEIASAKANVDGANAELVESEASYQRAQNLFKNKLTSQAALDGALAARDSNLAKQHSVKEQFEALIKGTRLEDLNMAQAHLDAVSAMLAGENKKLADLTIKATRDGLLDNLPWNLGERVTMGSPVAIVLAGKAPYARAYIPEPYRINVRVNDKLLVRVDGIEQPILSTVRWIANEPAFSPYYALNQQERSRLMYLAEIQLPEKHADLPNGIPVQIEFPESEQQ